MGDDDQITSSVNNLVSQTEDTTEQNTENNLGLGVNPASTDPEPDSSSQATSPPETGSATPSRNDSGENSDLEKLKNRALGELSPLLDKLDQAPEEKFHTLMMVIQATDDKSLIEKAYEAANQIKDDTKKAEALLAVVNEINYFSKEG